LNTAEQQDINIRASQVCSWRDRKIDQVQGSFR